MPLNEERLVRLKQYRSEQAIALAMQGRWRQAVEVNKSILEDFLQDVDTHNRLGRAYMELGEYPQAKEAYGRAAELDPYNRIARRNLQRLSYLKEPVKVEGEADKVEPQHFIEEIGKARVVNLLALASKEILARMVAGDKVHFKIGGTRLVAEDSRGEYLGQVTPRRAQRLIELMKGGNRYTAAVVSSAEDVLTIIIREIYQDPSQVGRVSFPPKGTGEVQPYISDRILKMESESGEAAKEESGYTIVGGDKIEVLRGESPESDDTVTDEE